MRSDNGELRRPLSVAFATCHELPFLDDDTSRLIAPLAARGATVTPAVWDDCAVRWEDFDLVVVRSCWDYARRRLEFLRWTQRVPNLANAAQVLAWNTDKSYLRDLTARGVPTVPTLWLEPADDWNSPCDGEWVVKPTVSLAALDTGRYRMSDPAERGLARAHVRRLQSAGRAVMVQPYFHRLDHDGETSLVYIGSKLSHAVRKAAVLTGPDVGLDRRFQADGGQHLCVCEPNAAQVALGRRVLAEVPGGLDGLLYARVDLVPDAAGRPVLMEVELTEPQLYFGHVTSAQQTMADAIADLANACRATSGDRLCSQQA